MAAGYRFLYDEHTPLNYNDMLDVRTKAIIVDELVDQLVALNIGWTVYKREYTSTSYTASTCYYNTYLRFRDSDHLLRLQIAGSSSSNKVTVTLFVMGLSEATALPSFPSAIVFYDYNVAPYTMRLGLTLFFGGSSWCLLHFRANGMPVGFAEDNSYSIYAATAEKITDSNTKLAMLRTTTSTANNIVEINTGLYPTGSDTALNISGTKDHLVSNNADFELMRDFVLNGTDYKLSDQKIFTNSFGLGVGTVFAINPDKWVAISTNYLAKLYDPA